MYGDFNENNDNREPFGPEKEYLDIPPRRGGGRVAKAVGKSILALALVAVIAVGSISGYLWMTGEQPQDLAAAVTTTVPADESNQAATKTNYVLSNAEGALTTPEVFIKASPWVVAISSEVESQNPYGGFYGQGNGSNISTATGTGIIMSSDGYIITNHHVVEGASRVSVTTNGSDTYEAVVVGMDETTDIAVLKIEATGLKAAEFGASSELLVGETAIVIGNPLGTDLADTLTQGVISSTERQVPFTSSAPDRSTFYMTLIQTDAAVNPGNSGGPLLNNRGQVVGVVNSKISQDDVEGIGFAIPSDVALSIAHDLIENGMVTIRPMLGITVYSFTEAQAEAYNQQYREQIALGTAQARIAGVIIDSVTPGSAAANGTNGGLKAGDKIIAFNGVEVKDSAELNYQKEKCKIGDTAVVTVVRDGAELKVEVTFVGGIAT